MRIERISDTQIRCTLSREDLANRNINLTELAYSTDKAKALFRDMMQQAHDELGFQIDDLPLMIEAIPIMPDSIVLIVTKVENPEELDTRFSRFTPGPESTPHSRHDLLSQMAGADDIIDLFKKLTGRRPADASHPTREASPEEPDSPPREDVDLVRIFEFFNMDDAISAAGALPAGYGGANALYRFDKSGCYQLVIHQSGETPEAFNRICNRLSEYGRQDAFSEASEAYFKEHARCIIPADALTKLAGLHD